MTDPNEDGSKPKFSFGFKKQIKSKVVQQNGPDANGETSQALEEAEVTHIENGLINGQTKPKKKEPVIERIAQANDWRIEKLQKIVDEGTATDQQKALLALLREGLQTSLPSVNNGTDDTKQLEQATTNGEPDDVDPDYDKINFSDFGAAFLRGRGWQKDEGIGRTNKRVVPLVVHAKGKTFDMGIKKKKKKDGGKDVEEESIPLGAGVAVCILYGRDEGKYGRVVSMEESGRCEVKLVDGSIHEVMDKILQTVTDKEYTESTKVINKTEVDKYKKREEKKEKDSKRNGDSLSRNVERRLSISNENKDDDEVQFVKASTSPPWPSTDLLVRVVSKKYKDGRYYKEKMTVVDAPRRSQIELRDDRGRVHTLDQDSLETVIPRGTGGQVRILKGPQKNRYGIVVDKDEKLYRLKVRVVGSNNVVDVDFDDACEYRGNLEEMDFE